MPSQCPAKQLGAVGAFLTVLRGWQTDVFCLGAGVCQFFSRDLVCMLSLYLVTLPSADVFLVSTCAS